jgi:hypothetical protein
MGSPAGTVAASQAQHLRCSRRLINGKLALYVRFSIFACNLRGRIGASMKCNGMLLPLCQLARPAILLCICSSVIFTSKADANKHGWRDYRQWLSTNQQQHKGTSPAGLQLQRASPAGAAHNQLPVGVGQKRAAPGGFHLSKVTSPSFVMLSNEHQQME